MTRLCSLVAKASLLLAVGIAPPLLQLVGDPASPVLYAWPCSQRPTSLLKPHSPPLLNPPACLVWPDPCYQTVCPLPLAQPLLPDRASSALGPTPVTRLCVPCPWPDPCYQTVCPLPLAGPLLPDRVFPAPVLCPPCRLLATPPPLDNPPRPPTPTPE